MARINMSADERRVERTKSAIRLYETRSGRNIVRDAYPDEPCVYCGGPAESRDHIVPVSRGGLHSRENMVPSCHRCNGIKADMLPQDFFCAHPRFAWRFARRAIHAKPVWLEMARMYGRRYEAKAVFEEADVD